MSRFTSCMKAINRKEHSGSPFAGKNRLARLRYPGPAALAVLGLVLVPGTACMTNSPGRHNTENWPPEDSPHFANGRFRNSAPVGALPFLEELALWPRFIFGGHEDAEPDQPIPVRAMTREQLLDLPSDNAMVARLGHSGLLLKLGSALWLIDPVFSRRASPVSFAGPKRFHPPPISADDLPAIKGVLISHNHYDHLDKAAIRALHEKVEHFHVPLGVGADLRRWGVPAEKITEFDWWQTQQVGDVTLAAMPAQHFSGRGPGDGNRSLWVSWALRSSDTRIFYSGDTGYIDDFKRIGIEYGPFDLTVLEVGAYDEKWPHVHMQPEEALKAHADLRGRLLLPVHNSTFNLAFHAWYEPLERISRLAADAGVALLTPETGQLVTLAHPDLPATRPWWRDLVSEEKLAACVTPDAPLTTMKP